MVGTQHILWGEMIEEVKQTKENLSGGGPGGAREAVRCERSVVTVAAGVEGTLWVCEVAVVLDRPAGSE